MVNRYHLDFKARKFHPLNYDFKNFIFIKIML